jgi:hypothetical protein
METTEWGSLLKKIKEAFLGQTNEVESPMQEGRPGRVRRRLYLINIQVEGHVELTR